MSSRTVTTIASFHIPSGLPTLGQGPRSALVACSGRRRNSNCFPRSAFDIATLCPNQTAQNLRKLSKLETSETLRLHQQRDGLDNTSRCLALRHGLTPHAVEKDAPLQFGQSMGAHDLFHGGRHYLQGLFCLGFFVARAKWGVAGFGFTARSSAWGSLRPAVYVCSLSPA